MANIANPSDGLIETAQAHFGELTDAEKNLLQAAPKGEWAQCGPNFSNTDPENDPAHAETWGVNRTIRACLLRWLCVDSTAKMRVDPKGVQVHGAVILNTLDLSFVVVPFPFGLCRCRLTHAANLTSAEIPALGLAGCTIGMLLADRLVTKGDVFLHHGFHAQGWVRLIGAKIGGKLDCVSGTFQNPAQNDTERAGKALSADGIRVSGAVSLCEGFRAEGEVRLPGAQIGGDLQCVGGTFHNPAQKGVNSTGTALNADGITVNGSVFLAGRFCAQGEVRLLGGVQITGQLVCVGGTFHNPAQKDLEETGKALSADGIVVHGGIFLSRGFHADGEVRLLGAKIGTNLECVDGMFHNPSRTGVESSGKAFSAKAVDVKGDVFLSKGFNADGEVRLPGAHIGGDLQCIGGTFHNPAQQSVEGTGTALTADGINVDGSVNLCEEFHAEGAVRLIGAQIGGDLNCGRGTFTNPVKPGLATSGNALQADHLNVKGGVLLGEGFWAEGNVYMPQAKIGMDLDCVGARFNSLIAEGISVGKILWWQKIREPAKTTLNLTNATTDGVLDDKESWPHRGRLYLDGFVYGRFPDGPRTAKERLEWLRRVEPFTPQPYRQLAKVLRDAGDDRGANAVLFAMEDRIWRDDNRPIARLWRWILWGTVGYGYRPLRTFWCLLGLTLLGWGIYGAANFAGEMVPTEEKAFQSFEATKGPPENYPRFFPWVYSLENSVPLIKLGQVDRWQPNPSSQASGPSRPIWYSRPQIFITEGRFLLYFRWGQNVAGWLLATLFVAGFTGIVRRV